MQVQYKARIYHAFCLGKDLTAHPELLLTVVLIALTLRQPERNHSINSQHSPSTMPDGILILFRPTFERWSITDPTWISKVPMIAGVYPKAWIEYLSYEFGSWS